MYPEDHSKLSINDQAAYPVTRTPLFLIAFLKRIYIQLGLYVIEENSYNTFKNIVYVVLVIVDSLKVIQIPCFVTESVLCYENLRITVSIFDPSQ